MAKVSSLTSRAIQDVVSLLRNLTWENLSNRPDSSVSDIDDAVSKRHSHANQAILDATEESYTSAEKTKLAGIETDAQVNQNAFSVVSIGEQQIAADQESDTLEFTPLAGVSLQITGGKVSIGMDTSSVPQLTSSDLTYYVSPSGSDTNDGLSSGSPFATIQHALDVLPKIVNHDVTVNVAAGSYNEAVVIEGFVGQGSISIMGSAAKADTHTTTSFTVRGCKLRDVYIRGINGVVSVKNTALSKFEYVKATGAVGFQADDSFMAVIDCDISNCGVGIEAKNGASVFSNLNTGSGNTTVLKADAASIGTNDTQPGGTTAEEALNGGRIYAIPDNAL